MSVCPRLVLGCLNPTFSPLNNLSGRALGFPSSCPLRQSGTDGDPVALLGPGCDPALTWVLPSLTAPSLLLLADKPEGNVPILPRGYHTFPFKFQLPESSLPCSFESKSGTIRYYIKVTVDIPYASPPQGMKYFTIIGPHIDCMDEQYLKPMVGHDKRSLCCLCCKRGPVSLRTQLERTAYVCGESIKLKADIDNQSEEEIKLKLKLVQYVEYFIDRGVLGVTKDIQHPVLEYTGDPVPAGTRWKFDSSHSLVVPVMPPTLVGVCRLMQIYYVLKVNIQMSRSGEDLHMHFPITIATVPFRIPNSTHQPNITYSVCCDHVEGGLYIGPEFQLGQVYDGGVDKNAESVLLYRPVYACIPNPKLNNTPSARARLLVEPKAESGPAGGAAGAKKGAKRASGGESGDKTSTM
ncbi:Arrestin domain-containing protein 3 [Penaeus vannamei]|uniref:Arrestin domain-containing protein 3 n=1 Tax=Penaeus vannamei TaxID=6689 RepID=A0A423S928_PENVA|nr:Arrestin domain-containing protein 3 [Penaeus vannamei]